MKLYQAVCIVVALLLLAQASEARRRKHKGGEEHERSEPRRTKTKTKWSTSSELTAPVTTEEHGYYVKRTYSPTAAGDKKQQSPPYLAIPIAWFSCAAEATNCQQSGNSGAINGAAQALSEGYLCDDDCLEPYAPICGKTTTEVAVFYNKCKLNVAKCRTHGMWTDLPYEQCQQTYPQETSYTDKKFRSSPYFRANSTASAEMKQGKPKPVEKDDSKSSEEQETEQMKPEVAPAQTVEAAMASALDEINAKLSEAEQVMAGNSEKEQARPVDDKDKLKYEIA